MSRQHRGTRSLYAQELRFVRANAIHDVREGFHETVAVKTGELYPFELLNEIVYESLKLFEDGEVLNDPYGRGTLDRVR